MNSSFKESSFPKAMRKAISEHGTQIIKDIKLFNILSDTMSFDNFPSLKNVLRLFLKEGFGNQLFIAFENTNSWFIKVSSLKTELITQKGFDSKIIDYIIMSFIYAYGKSDEVPSDIYIIQSINSEIDFTKEQNRLKDEYIKYLNDAIVIPDNKSGYYTTQSMSDIYALKGKISVLDKVLNTDYSKWCDDELTKILEDNRIEVQDKPIGILKRLLKLYRQ